jgi:hypothetical protein
MVPLECILPVNFDLHQRIPWEGPRMDDVQVKLLNDYSRWAISRRKVLEILGVATARMLLATTAFGQGSCRDGYGTKSCPMQSI